MTDKPTKLQQIAKALMECDIEQGHATREQAEMQWGRYEVLARTAVETVREPTEEMLDVVYGNHGETSGSSEPARLTWVTMIDEVLK